VRVYRCNCYKSLVSVTRLITSSFGVAVEIVLRLSAVCRDGQLLDQRGGETLEHTNLQATAGTFFGGGGTYLY
jgi:hypothetical protein